jgi:hypothetical protein
MSNTQIVVESRSKLSLTGCVGVAFLLVSPFLGAYLVNIVAERMAFRIRVGLSTPASAYSDFYYMGAIAVAFFALGLVMVLTGREYTHTIEIQKPGQVQG